MQRRTNIKIPTLGPTLDTQVPPSINVAPDIVARANSSDLPPAGAVKKLPTIAPAKKIPILRRGEEEVRPRESIASPMPITISVPKKIVVPPSVIGSRAPNPIERVNVRPDEVKESLSPGETINEAIEEAEEKRIEEIISPMRDLGLGPPRRDVITPTQVVKSISPKRPVISPSRVTKESSEVSEILVPRTIEPVRGSKSKRLDIFRPPGAVAKTSKRISEPEELSLLEMVREAIVREPGLVSLETQVAEEKPAAPTRTTVMVKERIPSKTIASNFMISPEHREKLAKLPSTIDKEMLLASRESRAGKNTYKVDELKQYIKNVTGKNPTGKKQDLANMLLDLYEIGESLNQ